MKFPLLLILQLATTSLISRVKAGDKKPIFNVAKVAERDSSYSERTGFFLLNAMRVNLASYLEHFHGEGSGWTVGLDETCGPKLGGGPSPNLGCFSWYGGLQDAARFQSRAMHTINKLQHDTPTDACSELGSADCKMTSRVVKFVSESSSGGMGNNWAVAENIYWGSSGLGGSLDGPFDAMAAWLKSKEGHCETMLSGEGKYDFAAVGRVGGYWTQDYFRSEHVAHEQHPVGSIVAGTHYWLPSNNGKKSMLSFGAIVVTTGSSSLDTAFQIHLVYNQMPDDRQGSGRIRMTPVYSSADRRYTLFEVLVSVAKLKDTAQGPCPVYFFENARAGSSSGGYTFPRPGHPGIDRPVFFTAGLEKCKQNFGNLKPAKKRASPIIISSTDTSSSLPKSSTPVEKGPSPLQDDSSQQQQQPTALSKEELDKLFEDGTDNSAFDKRADNLWSMHADDLFPLAVNKPKPTLNFDNNNNIVNAHNKPVVHSSSKRPIVSSSSVSRISASEGTRTLSFDDPLSSSSSEPSPSGNTVSDNTESPSSSSPSSSDSESSSGRKWIYIGVGITIPLAIVIYLSFRVLKSRKQQ